MRNRLCSGLFALLAVANVSAPVAADVLPTGSSQFRFSNWQGPELKIRMYLPESHSSKSPIVIVMHGASRDAERYFADWAPLGEQHGFIVVVPEFTKNEFEKSARYNLGHVFEASDGALRPVERWTFASIEPLFDEVVSRVNGLQTGYTIYGHSAGSQFVHRFLYYVPEARVHRYIAANAGWYTLPVFDIDYPYGLQGAAIEANRQAVFFTKELILLLGREDTDPNASKLRQTEEAKRQGPNRLARGLTMYRVAKQKAEELGVPFNWQLMLVDNADHDNARMAPAAARLVEQHRAIKVSK